MQQPKSLQQWTELYKRLHMSDNGTRIAICDTCWGAVATPPYNPSMSIQNTDPDIVPNLLLRAALRG